MDKLAGSIFLGFIVNPVAGVGGPSALKGSDAESTRELFVSGRLLPRAATRALEFIRSIEHIRDIKILAAPGDMGADCLSVIKAEQGLVFEVLAHERDTPSTSKDTRAIAMAMLGRGIDILVFVGGDGTARDICSVVRQQVPVLGVPSGVKMHSGVFAITPKAAGKVLDEITQGSLVSLLEKEVRDIDELAFQKGVVRSRYFGCMWVPDELRYMQNVKQGGVEVDELVLADIAAEIKERLNEEIFANALIVFAPGSTTQFIQEELGVPGTLLGVDVMQHNKLVARDITADDLEEMVVNHPGEIRIILTAIGGQGHIIGRGNQQLSPSVLKAVKRENLWVVMTKTKLNNLESRPLLIDSNDPDLDEQWSGLIPVITGYHDQVLYTLGC